jgi:GntR family transcriptional regulator, transcriptional repressor for pyruvate dehydrogenase complex
MAQEEEVQVPKAAELIASQLRRQIVMGERAEGEVFPSELTLMNDLGVSRPTLRQAFRILENEHLVRIYRGRNGGTRVSRPSVDAASRYLNNLLVFKGATPDDVHKARLLLEPAAVADIAGRLDEQDIASLRELVLRSRDEANPARRRDLNDEFHVRLVELTANRSLTLYARLLTRLMDVPSARRRPPQSSPAEETDDGLDVAEAHSRAIDLIAAGASQEASRHWRAHLDAEHARLAKSLDTGAPLDVEG